MTNEIKVYFWAGQKLCLTAEASIVDSHLPIPKCWLRVFGPCLREQAIFVITLQRNPPAGLGGLVWREGRGTAVATGLTKVTVLPATTLQTEIILTENFRGKHRRQSTGIRKNQYLHFLDGELAQRHVGIYSKATT